MADKTEIPYFNEPSRAIQLRIWVLGQMVWGAFIAGLLVAGIGLTLLVIWGIGLLLPQQSKEMPSPFGAIELAAPAVLPA
ncbi:MAG: RC-LH1 core complex protein PufX [Rhodobacteraceae bacterium]|nr:RC-LH1 core complex protein PufX [Paracoccaceae bacterium]